MMMIYGFSGIGASLIKLSKMYLKELLLNGLRSTKLN